MHDDDHRTWNVFRRRRAPGLCCAVPAEAPVPAFLLCGDWDFGFAVADGAFPLTGFSLAAAEVGAAFNGFHLFLAFMPPLGPAPGGIGAALKRHSRRPRREPNGGFAHSVPMGAGAAPLAGEDRCPSTPTG